MVDGGIGITTAVAIGSKFIERSKFTARHDIIYDKEADKGVRLAQRFDNIPKEDVDQFERDEFNLLHSRSLQDLRSYRSALEEHRQKEWLNTPAQKYRLRTRVRKEKRRVLSSIAREEAHVDELETYSRSNSSRCSSVGSVLGGSESGLNLERSRPYRTDSCSIRATGGSPPSASLDDINMDERRDRVAAEVSNWLSAVGNDPAPLDPEQSDDDAVCHICERRNPQRYSETHTEICSETHRLEAEIVKSNESITELRYTIRELSVTVDRSSPTTVPEYRDMQVSTLLSTVSPPLKPSRLDKIRQLGVKKMQRRLLDQIDDVLQVALEIEMPSLEEEETKEPIERQRLLSPSSERKITQIRQWSKPTIEDAALSLLLQDAERVMRQKIDNVVSMENAIRYSEKIWLEQQERVESALTTIDEFGSQSEGSISDEAKEQKTKV